MEFKDEVKVWLSCPQSHVDQVREAIGEAGIGVIGNYTHCSFVSTGTGYFKPGEEANPHIGEVGSEKSVEELVIEFICRLDQIETLKRVVAKHHPYEEPAMDVFPLVKI